MIVYYAPGVGLGHVTRCRAFLYTMHIAEEAVCFISSQPRIDSRALGGMTFRHYPPEPGKHNWNALAKQLADIGEIEAFYSDTFPAGYYGELQPGILPEGVPCYHVARRLRWDTYKERIQARALAYTATYLPEPLTTPHRVYLQAQSQWVQPIELCDPPAEMPPIALPERYWLIVASTPLKDCVALVEVAVQQRQDEAVALVFVAPGAPTTTGPLLAIADQVDVWIDVYPAYPLFEKAERIFTSASPAAYRQTAAYRQKHMALPFSAAFDDQDGRYALYQENHHGTTDSATRPAREENGGVEF